MVNQAQPETTSSSSHTPANHLSQTTDKLTFSFKELPVLHAAYMPYLKNGGIFIITSMAFKLGARIAFDINILDEPLQQASGTIAWVTPRGSQGNRAQGIGVHFDDETSLTLRPLIEAKLAGLLSSEKMTHTL